MPYAPGDGMPALVRALKRLGAGEDLLPAAGLLAELRRLSSRQRAVEVMAERPRDACFCGASQICRSLDEIDFALQAGSPTGRMLAESALVGKRQRDFAGWTGRRWTVRPGTGVRTCWPSKRQWSSNPATGGWQTWLWSFMPPEGRFLFSSLLPVSDR